LAFDGPQSEGNGDAYDEPYDALPGFERFT
jgi:hypothetical protein